jgi:low affinity Fe/Cu permease
MAARRAREGAAAMARITEQLAKVHSFSDIARLTANALGSPWAFGLACLSVLLWALAGPHFHYSEIWQLYINTGTTIATFLVVFLIQNTQNRDAQAIHLKLDELIRATHAARNRLINLENCTDEDLKEMQREFDRMRDHVNAKSAGKPATQGAGS